MLYPTDYLFTFSYDRDTLPDIVYIQCMLYKSTKEVGQVISLGFMAYTMLWGEYPSHSNDQAHDAEAQVPCLSSMSV